MLIILYSLFLTYFNIQVFSFTFQSNLNSTQYGTLNLNFTILNQSNYVYNTNFTLFIQTTFDNSTVKIRNWTLCVLPTKFIQNIDNQNMQLGIATWKIMNLENQRIYFRFNLTTNPLNATIQQLFKRRDYLYFQIGKSNLFYAFILSASISSSFIPPLNSVDLEFPNIFIDQLNSQISSTSNFQTSISQNYFSYNSIINIAMPWIPYFSNCINFDRRIYMDQVMPQLTQKIYHTTNMWKWLLNSGNLQKIKSKTTNLQCVLQESYMNTDKNPWWQSQSTILYYIFPYALSGSQFLNLKSNSEYLNYLVTHFNKQLVPVYYYPKNSYILTPSKIQFTIKFTRMKNIQKIISAQIKAEFDNTQSINKTMLTINLEMLDNFQKILLLCLQNYSYGLIFLLTIGIILFFIIIFANFIDKLKLYTFLSQFVINIGFPLLKGFTFSIIMTFSMGLIFFIIFKNVDLSVFNGTYDGPVASTINLSRLGLILAYGGYFLGKTIIDMTFKIPSIHQVQNILKEQQKKKIVTSMTNNSNEVIDQEIPQLQQKRNFFIHIIESKRNYLLINQFIIPFVVIYVFQLLVVIISLSEVFFNLIIFILMPFVTEIVCYIYENLMIKDWIFIHALLMLQQVLFCVNLIGYRKIQMTILITIIRKIYLIIFHIIIQKLKNNLFNYLKQNKKSNKIAQFFYQVFQNSITKQFQSQKQMKVILIITAHLGCAIIRPILLAFLLIIQTQTQLNIKFFIQQKYIQVYIIFAVFQLFFQLLLVLIIIYISIKYFKINIFQMLQYNLHKFKIRNCKWISQSSGSNQYICQYFRNVDKLCFSSQLYFFTFTIFFSHLLLSLGISIIQTNLYSFYSDPFLVISFILMYFGTSMIKMLGTFLCHKFKLYAKVTQKNLSNLQTIQNHLKNESLQKYLDLQPVKNHFLMYNKIWIIKNLSNLFSVRDFYSQNKFLLNNYLLNLNKQKRKQIQSKKKEILMRMQNEQNINKPQKANNIISIRLPTLNNIIKPIVYNWLYLSKQQVYLRKLIQNILIDKKLKYCEFCKIDTQLQVLQNQPFYKIVNKFRLNNAGRLFTPIYFQQFYKLKQIFTTICIDCKSKKQHIKRNEKNELKKIKDQVCAKNMIKKWLIIARSNLLHNKKISPDSKQYIQT